MIAAPSVKMKTVGEFLERLEVYPDQTVVATVGLEGGYSPVHLAMDGLGKKHGSFSVMKLPTTIFSHHLNTRNWKLNSI
ncbi:hypothetical protein LOS25_15880 [Enterococcus faecium]|nr:hypothetical protein [Enterococcus faecium]